MKMNDRLANILLSTLGEVIKQETYDVKTCVFIDAKSREWIRESRWSYIDFTFETRANLLSFQNRFADFVKAQATDEVWQENQNMISTDDYAVFGLDQSTADNFFLSSNGHWSGKYCPNNRRPSGVSYPSCALTVMTAVLGAVATIESCGWSLNTHTAHPKLIPSRRFKLMIYSADFWSFDISAAWWTTIHILSAVVTNKIVLFMIYSPCTSNIRQSL